MKKSLLFSMIAMIGISAVAADITKEQFVAKEKTKAETAGKEFDEAKVIASFEKKDRNSDGVLSADEQAPAKPKTTDTKNKKK